MAWARGRRLIVIAATVILGGGLVAAALAATAESNPDTHRAAEGPRGPQPARHPTSGPSAPQVPPVIVPGRPGESASTVPADRVTAPDGTVYNSMDAWFVRMMIPHHEQAVQIAALAPSRARNPQIRALAERIAVGQAGEIDRLKAWLRARGLDDRVSGHDHTTMRGMQPPAALRALAAAQGRAFDVLFVDMMSQHHQGAIDMAADVLRGGTNLEVEQLANDIASEQAIEINRMRDVIAA
ncbi:MAG TPA: DUF305 domain-containing protein [Pilimelia sp.]|nr:DUF305 domain-containing protein [Pilimelia sp.]